MSHLASNSWPNRADPKAPSCSNPRASMAILGVALVAGLALIGAALILKEIPPDLLLARAAVALLPVIPFVWLLIVMARATRQLDEMWARLQLEALALTMPAFAIITVVVGQLQKVHVLGDINWAFIWPAMGLVYGLANWFVCRRRA